MTGRGPQPRFVQTFSKGISMFGVRFEPGWHRQVLRAQELRVEQLGLVAGAEVGEHRDDGVAGPHVLGEADRARDIDAG